MFEKVWQEFHQELLNFIQSKVNDQVIAEDILQEVFLKVHQRLDTLSEIKQLNAWLYQICKNTIIDYYRTKKLVPLSNTQEELLISPTELHEDNQQLNRCIHILISDLPNQYNDILLASELNQEKQQIIAEQQQLSLSAVKSRIKRGRTLLKQKLVKCCDFEFSEGIPNAICKNNCGCSA